MSELINEKVSFGHGFVQGPDKVRVIARFDDMAEQGSAASMLMMWAGERRGWRHFELGWTAIRVACSSSAIFALGAGGRVMIADANGVREERIDGPDERGDLRDLCLVGGTPLVVGAGGQTYRRAGEGSWVEIDGGSAGAAGAPELRAVDASGEDDVVAVGEGGAILRLTEGEWQRLESPTDRALSAVRLTAPGELIAVGEGGVVLRGKGGELELAGGGAPEDLLGVERFGDRDYAASERGLYAVDADGRVERVRVFDGPSWTYRHLHAGGGALWSFGREHLIWTADGRQWNLLRSPFQSIDPTELGAGGGSCGCGSDHHHHC